MKTQIELAEQVAAFLKSLAPEPRRKLRLGLRALADGKGDIKELTDTLSGFQRLRVGSYRVIYDESFDASGRKILCLFAERRAVVYELFTELLLSDLS
jgi:mRNA-degrading endonuclease RelE of RelBE toxin-antitoxin system